MLNFLHTFNPQPILFSFGPINIYWYGLFMVLGIIAALAITIKIAAAYQIKKDTIFDLAFWLILFGLFGARVYDVFLEYQYYINHPSDVFKIWQGGLAIHGAILAGIITLWIFTKKQKLNFWLLTSIITPGLALGQAIGRWGNYFNQELFGLPTSLPWGIPIAIYNRRADLITAQYFHPTFLYESLGSLLIFIILIFIHRLIIKKCNQKPISLLFTCSRAYMLTVFFYAFGYSVLRFSLEFIRIDFAPTIFGWRWPQLISLIISLISLFVIIYVFSAIAKDKRQRP
ncbi:MAG: Prolipoprotein diacylglyceryl transferase [Parcubacteria group bacterium GW2011_GWE2_39_37]|uniref:Phosphatidylglycerol--prolipoprotein diacylglyceryl transferase n=1 Tax=Candidatus Falkowbacteria bacterium GW2011_GWF2_39_8 TaxID=1618642 RepID=A0A0G0T4N1_9BACT|nr:MAG: Prolipoprotein diacylglyceryl transferase [Parcubacteria group bacterium GW2011_GWE2_39_37]KKR32762.1 MAG: Prolipoprotein diacylglyceryl transferase [Candidatus Falkowbacteria bacterium GW2011_GWF2_39_8]